MDKKKFKRIIAREGLTLLGIVLLACVLFLTEPLAIKYEFLPYFIPLYITYASIRLIFLGIAKFNLRISRFDKNGILITIVSLLVLHLRNRVNYIQEPYPKIVEAAISLILICACLFILVILIRFIIWAVRTLKEKNEN